MPNQDIIVLVLTKGKERYVFLYDDENLSETIRALGRFASNPDLSFTWYDAAILSQKIRQQTETQEEIENQKKDRNRFRLPF